MIIRLRLSLARLAQNDLSVVFLILANLLPIWGVIFLEWNAASMLMLYWAENLVVGLYNLFKIAFAGSLFWKLSSKFFMMIFFLFHYGAFTAVHGMFLMTFLKIGGGEVYSGGDDAGIFVFVLMLKWTFLQFWHNMPEGMLLPLLALLASHGFSFVYNYLLGKEYESATPDKQMMQPYGRVVVLHVVILAGGILMQGLAPGSAMLVLLVILKIVLDIILHVRSHQRTGKAEEQPASVS